MLLVVPRPGTRSPWSSKATDIAQNCGLDAVLRTRQSDILGILNGIDTNVWNPAVDPKIVVPSYMARVQDSRDGNSRGRFLGRG